MNSSTVFVVHLLATWYMVGLIWMVQIVHYKMFDRVGVEQFARYESDHSRLITPIVAVPMIIEILTAAALLASAPPALPRSVIWAGLVMLIGIWLSTALLQVPCHNRLTQGFDQATYEKLVSTNWIRTSLWTVRGVMLGYYARQMI